MVGRKSAPFGGEIEPGSRAGKKSSKTKKVAKSGGANGAAGRKGARKKKS
jgi:hypothetical protein